MAADREGVQRVKRTIGAPQRILTFLSPSLTSAHARRKLAPRSVPTLVDPVIKSTFSERIQIMKYPGDSKTEKYGRLIRAANIKAD